LNRFRFLKKKIDLIIFFNKNQTKQKIITATNMDPCTTHFYGSFKRTNIIRVWGNEIYDRQIRSLAIAALIPGVRQWCLGAFYLASMWYIMEAFGTGHKIRKQYKNNRDKIKKKI
jgi:hypothetical protein